jgi:flagellar hook-associated protein 1 FlgK
VVSIFGTLNTAVSGLRAAQRAMDVTGQNISNVNTEGYSRQRVELSTSGMTSTATLFTGDNTQYSGVTIDAVTRIRDAFLEARRAAAGGRQSALTGQTAVLTAVQQLTAEPTDSGLQSTIDAFYAAWHDLAANPTDVAAGQVVLQRGAAVADRLHGLSSGLKQEWSTTHDHLADVLTQANQDAAGLAELNGQIRAGTIAGHSVNDLLDKRDVLVRSLASLVGATALPGEDNQVSVTVGGVSIVSGQASHALTLGGANDLTAVGANPPVITVGSITVSLESGTGAGLLAATKADLPSVLTAVDGVAVALRDVVNSVHRTGFTAGGATGTDFFAGSDAESLQVVPATPTDLAIASAAGITDGSVAAKIGDLMDDATAAAALGSPGPSALWRQLTSQLGVRVQSLQAATAVQESVVSSTDDAVNSDAGVNLDEEMTNMLLYQRSYQASARVITAVDQMMATLMTTGEVGR